MESPGVQSGSRRNPTVLPAKQAPEESETTSAYEQRMYKEGDRVFMNTEHAVVVSYDGVNELGEHKYTLNVTVYGPPGTPPL